MTAAGKYHLYTDDTGSRDPDKAYAPDVHEGRMDCFGLGGIIIKEADIDATIQAHKRFCDCCERGTDDRGGGRRRAPVYSRRVGGYAMPQITFVRLIAFAVVLFGSVVAASAGKKQFPTGGNKPMPTPTISCKQACMLGFDKCRKKVMDKENVCCTADQNRAIKFCLKALYECEYPSADPYRGFPKKE
jgi:hypothetical protein